MTSAPGHPGPDDRSPRRADGPPDPDPNPDGLGEAIRTGRVPVVPGSLVDLVMRSGSGEEPEQEATSEDDGARREPTPTGFTELVSRDGGPAPSARPSPGPRPADPEPPSDPGDYADLGDLGDDPLGVGPLPDDPGDDGLDALRTPADRFAPPPSFAPDSPDGPATPATDGAPTPPRPAPVDAAPPDPRPGPSDSSRADAPSDPEPAPETGSPVTGLGGNRSDPAATPAEGGRRTDAGPGPDGVPVTEPAPTVVPPIAPTPRPLGDDARPAAGPTPNQDPTPSPSAGDTTRSGATGSDDEGRDTAEQHTAKRWPPRPARSSADGPETDILPPGALIGHYPNTDSTDGRAEPPARPSIPPSGSRPTMPGHRPPAPAGPERQQAPRPAMGGVPSGPAMAGLSGNDLFATVGGDPGSGFGRLPSRADDPRDSRTDGAAATPDADRLSPDDVDLADSPRDDSLRDSFIRDGSVRDGSVDRGDVPGPAAGAFSGPTRTGAFPGLGAGPDERPGGPETNGYPDGRPGGPGTGGYPAGRPERQGAGMSPADRAGGQGTGTHPVGRPGGRGPGPYPTDRPGGPETGGRPDGPGTAVHPQNGPGTPGTGRFPAGGGPRPAPRDPGARSWAPAPDRPGPAGPDGRTAARPDPASDTASDTETTVVLRAVGTDDGPPTLRGLAPAAGHPDAPAPADGTAGASDPDQPDAATTSRNAAAAASVGAVSVAAARAASGRDGTIEDTAESTAVQPAAAEAAAHAAATGDKPVVPRHEAIMSAKPRNGRRSPSAAGLAIALAIVLLGALTLWAMLSPSTSTPGANATRPAVSAGPGTGPRPEVAAAGTSLAQPTVRATVQVAGAPVAVAAAPDGATALVVVRDANRLAVVDTATDAVTGEIGLPAAPQGLVTSPDGTRAYVSTGGPGGGQIAVVDVPGRTVVGTAAVGGDPGAASVSPDGRFLYVPSRTDGTVQELDPNAGTVTRTVPVSRDPYAGATNAAGDRVYLATRGADQLTVLDPDSLTVLGSFPVRGGAESLAVTPASVPRTMVAVGGPESGTVMVLDPSDGREIATVQVDGGATGMAFAPDGRHLYVATRQGLVTVDAGTWQVTGTTDVAPNPTGVAVAPDGRTGWVTGDGAVSVLNLT